ncbi:MAG TPA: tRNA uracil 4-sulfurtransferase ThiI [Anaerolineae bacterium]|nr:tRNA uracil 4-sulfurtransferase ThiI [Anaerolineae bacterium]HQH38900.1 tRNA uracil 4-sulfurtransferase ThiI [Anaerolineae bacterium]
MQVYIVHFGELGLKGRNRIFFARQLINNIRTVFTDTPGTTVQFFHSHILVQVCADMPAAAIEQRLGKIFGIAYYAPATIVATDFEAISQAALHLAASVITPTTTFKVNTTRGDKRFPVTSQNVDCEIGARIVAMIGAPVKLKDPAITLTIQIYEDATYLFIRRIPGAGGLPVGVSGRVLALFSGGIDSPVAAHMMLKRGCTLDLLHFHLLPDVEQARTSKIVAMARTVLAPHRLAAPLYMISAAPFEAAMAAITTRVATVVFRRFIMRVAERLAEQRHCLALVTGESVGQVASQTLPNISMINRATTLPVLRPLIGYDKAEIIAAAQRLGTYDLSIQPYRDPCSLHAPHPATQAGLDEILRVESEIDVTTLVEETLRAYVDEVWINF